jgi:hypothetical protein
MGEILGIQTFKIASSEHCYQRAGGGTTTRCSQVLAPNVAAWTTCIDRVLDGAHSEQKIGVTINLVGNLVGRQSVGRKRLDQSERFAFRLNEETFICPRTLYTYFPKPTENTMRFFGQFVAHKHCLWALQILSSWLIESRACNEPENKLFGQPSSFREREPPDSSWRKSPPV